MIAGDGYVNPSMTVLVTLIGMLIVAALDVWRHEVEDIAIVALMTVAVVGFELEGVSGHQWFVAALSAGVAFMTYMHLALQGILGGGDVKLAVIPAFVLGALHPLLGVWWVAVALMIHQAIYWINVRIQNESAAIPHVPSMAIAAVISSLAVPAVS